MAVISHNYLLEEKYISMYGVGEKGAQTLGRKYSIRKLGYLQKPIWKIDVQCKGALFVKAHGI